MKRITKLEWPTTLRDRLLHLAAERELYADRARERRESLAYRDAAAGLRRELARPVRHRLRA